MRSPCLGSLRSTHTVHSTAANGEETKIRIFNDSKLQLHTELERTGTVKRRGETTFRAAIFIMLTRSDHLYLTSNYLLKSYYHAQFASVPSCYSINAKSR